MPAARWSTLLLTMTLASPALAQQPVAVDIAGRTVRLVVAPGQCAFDRNQAADRRIFDLASRAIAGQNELLLHTGECRNLAELRAGRARSLNDFAQAQVSIQLKTVELAGREAESVLAVCNELRNQGDKIAKDVNTDIKDRVRNLQSGIAVNETRSLGILAEDNTACYSGIILNIADSISKSRLIVGVYAITVLSGRLLFLYRYAADPGDGALQRLLDQQRKAVADHLAANPTPGAAANPPAAPPSQPTTGQPQTDRKRLRLQ